MIPYLPNQPVSILLLGGRAPACLEWARLLNKLGHSVHVADSVSPFLTQFSSRVHLCHKLSPPAFAFDLWQEQITHIVKKHHIQLIIPTCEEVFYLAKACMISAELKTMSWIADFKTLMHLHDKFAFFEMVDKSNSLIKVPESYLIKQDMDRAGVLKILLKLYAHLPKSNLSGSKDYTDIHYQQMLDTPCRWVIKPCLSRFATRTLICPTLSELLSALYDTAADETHIEILKQMLHIQTIGVDHQDDSLSTIDIEDSRSQRVANSWIAQAYIEGNEMASYSLAQAGQLVAHTCYEAQCRTQTATNKTGLGGDNEASQVGASLDFNSINEPQIVDFVSACVANLNYTGQLAFDFIKDANEIYWALECNPRATSGIHLLACDTQFLAKLGCNNEYYNNEYYARDINATVFEPDLSAFVPFIQTASTHCSLKFAVVYEMLKNPKLIFTTWQVLADSKDVIFDKDDMRPVLGQFVASLDLLWQAWRHKKNILTMSTHDIKWDDELDS